MSGVPYIEKSPLTYWLTRLWPGVQEDEAQFQVETSSVSRC
jgi:hypothetical protein